MQANQQSQSEARAMEERAVVSGMLDLSTFELLRHATSRENQEARKAWQRCFGEVLRSWLHRHPRSEEACRFGVEERYLAQTCEGFWQTVDDWQLQASTSLAQRSQIFARLSAYFSLVYRSSKYLFLNGCTR